MNQGQAEADGDGREAARSAVRKSGTQYVVIAAGGDGGRFGKSDRIVAFAIDGRAR
jgi:hypothetical protein